MDDIQMQKLEKFSKSVNAEVGEHISKIMDEANKQSSKNLEKAENDALLEAYNKIQKAVRDTESKYRKMYALVEQKCRMQALRHREELSQKIFSSVEQKLNEFVASEKYGEYLLNIAKNEKLSAGTVAAVSPKDEKYGEQIKKYGYELKPDDSIEIGGIMFIDSKKGLIIDKTFDSALEEQKKVFSSKYSFKAGN